MSTVKAALLSDRVADVLANARQPLTLVQISEKVGGEDVGAAVKELIQRRRVFAASVVRNRKRYWGKDEEQLAQQALRELLGAAPRSAKQLVADLAKKVRTGASETWRKDQVAKLRKSDGIHEHPKGGKAKAATLALSPPVADTYVTEGLLEPLRGLLGKLKRAGVAEGEVLAAVAKRLGIETRAIPEAKPATDDEVKRLIFEGMEAVNPRAGQMAPVSLPELREWMPQGCRGRETFDRVILALVSEERVSLQSHDYAPDLSERERRKLVQDGKGNYFVIITKRA